MTIADNKCEVCFTRPPIGVASTSIPLSVAYCQECAEAGADPESVFEYFYSDCFGADFDKMAEGYPDKLVTWCGGRYITYREWATAKAAGVVP